jgi:predicted HTH transcriptional regulator
MSMARSELLEKIRLGEAGSLELKEVRFEGKHVSAPHRDALANELAAFANARGGILVLGVEDKTRKIVGIPMDGLDAVEAFVRDICTDRINPPLYPAIDRISLPSAEGGEVAVIVADVERSLFVHESPGGYLLRVGSAKRKMPPDLLARLFQQRSQARIIRFDEQVVPGAALNDLDESLWRRFAPVQSQDRPEDLLVKLGMARADVDGEVRPTLSGVLMASADPRRWIPNAYIQAVAYRGDSVVPDGETIYQLDAKDCSGPLDQQVIEACRFVLRNMKTAAYKRAEGGRVDIPQFDIPAVFEALVNAVAHRDYSIYGSKIRLRLFNDRLEIYSPGAIPNTMTVESLPYRQSARNETIAGLLAKSPIPKNQDWLVTDRSNLMDKRGEGVPVIMRRSLALSGKSPEYRLVGDSELILTIYAANPEQRP